MRRTCSAAAAAAEAVALFALIWVAFQGYVAVALTLMWQTERAGLGPWYIYLELTGIVLTIAVAIGRMRASDGRHPRPFVPEHWRFGQLYKNPRRPGAVRSYAQRVALDAQFRTAGGRGPHGRDPRHRHRLDRPLFSVCC